MTKRADGCFRVASARVLAGLDHSGNFGLGTGTRDQAERAGRAWVGDDYRLSSNGSTLISRDGLRQYRPPKFKPREGRVQANFQERLAPEGEWQSNGHLDIED